MEIDLDIHCYAYLARKALHGFLGRLGGLVIDAAFIVQGEPTWSVVRHTA